MKKKLPSARFPLPKFRSEKEAAEYFDGHSVAAIWDQLGEVKPANHSAALAKRVRERHARVKAAFSIRPKPDQIEAAIKPN